MDISTGTGMDQPSPESVPYRCVISAGPTREYLDPFRFISNPSSGKMGYALAEAALALGWSVDLVSGPTSLPEPSGCIFYPVVTGEEMFHQIDALYDACDILIMSAAVSDYRPTHYSDKKIKKEDTGMSLSLSPVIDILKTVNKRKQGQYVVGFAAETNDLEKYAWKKLKEKNLDMVVANPIGLPGSGFGGEQNELTVLFSDGRKQSLGPADKKLLGQDLVRLLLEEVARKKDSKTI